MTIAAGAGRRDHPAEAEGEAPAGAVEPAPSPAAGTEVTLDFALPPEAAARLPRLPFVLDHRRERMRSGALEAVWFDTADGALAAAGLAVEATKRGPRRLIRLLPPAAAPWHPCRPNTALRDLAPQDIPPEAGAGPLVAISAFTGRRHAFGLALAEGPVAAVLLTGRLRSVAAESEAARLSLSGPLPAVMVLARAIAAELPLAPPRAALAEEGRALATGTPARPHRLGAPDTSEATSAEDAFLRATGHLLEVLHQQAARIGPQAGPDPVHQSRVALRRLRSLLRVFRTVTDCAALRHLDGRLKEAVSAFGPARDWDVFLAGAGAEVAAAFPDDRRIAGLLRVAGERRAAAYDTAMAMLGAPAWRLLLIDALETLLGRPWRTGATPDALLALQAPVAAFGRAVLDRRWQRLRRAGEDFASLDAKALHELRLDGKRLRYAAEVFAPIFGARSGGRFLRRLAALQDGLGIANDAAVARHLVRVLASPGQAGRSWAIGAVEGWCEARAASHRGDAHEAWERLSGKDRFWTGN